MVYTQLAQRRQQFHVAPAVRKPNNAVSTSLRWILNITQWKKKRIHSESHATELSDSAREQRIGLYKAVSHVNINVVKCSLPAERQVLEYQKCDDLRTFCRIA